MNKSNLFIPLIKACQRIDGAFGVFKQHCMKDPKSFFEKKNLSNEYNSLTDEEKEIFTDEIKFFNLLVKYGFKTEENIIQNLIPKCKGCGKPTTFINIVSGYKNVCSKKCIRVLIQKTCMEKYGVDTPFESEEVKQKIKKSNLKKYGVEHASQSKVIRDKAKQTLIKNYGVDSPLKSNILKDKAKKTNLERYGVEHSSQSNIIKEKIKNTNLERYGVEHALQSNILKDKAKKTNLERYGVEHALQSNILKDKVKKTNLERYGVEHALQSNILKDKVKQTCMEKYGVEYASQSEEVKQKIKESNLEKYGFSSPRKSDIVKEKYVKTCMEKYGVSNSFKSEEIKEKIKESNLEKYGVEFAKQKNFRNLDKLNVEFIKENFTEGKKINVCEAKKFFNIKAHKSTLLDKVLVSLEKEGYKVTREFVSEKEFISNLETSLNTTLKRQYRIPNTTFKTDGYDPKTNTIYEFLGDYWHGNPKIFDFDKVNVNNGVSFRELNQKTFERFDEIKKLGYTIKYVWENDYNESGLDKLITY